MDKLSQSPSPPPPSSTSFPLLATDVIGDHRQWKTTTEGGGEHEGIDDNRGDDREDEKKISAQTTRKSDINSFFSRERLGGESEEESAATDSMEAHIEGGDERFDALRTFAATAAKASYAAKPSPAPLDSSLVSSPPKASPYSTVLEARGKGYIYEDYSRNLVPQDIPEYHGFGFSHGAHVASSAAATSSSSSSTVTQHPTLPLPLCLPPNLPHPRPIRLPLPPPPPENLLYQNYQTSINDFQRSNLHQIEISIRAQKLPIKLNFILSQPFLQHIISWRPHGRAWRIEKPKDFVDEVMSRYFEYQNYSSFVRLVNAWGFRRFTQGHDRGAYFHELFLRGLPHLHQRMRRLTSSDKKVELSREEEPDFYEISRENPVPELPDRVRQDSRIAQQSIERSDFWPHLLSQRQVHDVYVTPQATASLATPSAAITSRGNHLTAQNISNDPFHLRQGLPTVSMISPTYVNMSTSAERRSQLDVNAELLYAQQEVNHAQARRRILLLLQQSLRNLNRQPPTHARLDENMSGVEQSVVANLPASSEATNTSCPEISAGSLAMANMASTHIFFHHRPFRIPPCLSQIAQRKLSCL